MAALLHCTARIFAEKPLEYKPQVFTSCLSTSIKSLYVKQGSLTFCVMHHDFLSGLLLLTAALIQAGGAHTVCNHR